jgi:hypothetical protein
MIQGQDLLVLGEDDTLGDAQEIIVKHVLRTSEAGTYANISARCGWRV